MCLLADFYITIPRCQSQFRAHYIYSSHLPLEMGAIIIPIFTDEEIQAQECQFPQPMELIRKLNSGRLAQAITLLFYVYLANVSQTSHFLGFIITYVTNSVSYN